MLTFIQECENYGKNQVILTNVENFWDVSGLMCNIIGGER